MTQVALSRISDTEGAVACDSLFREYGELSTERLARDCGVEFGESELQAVHEAFRQEWPKLFSPRGRLYLASVDGEPAGVGALKPVTAETGELKRMFVRSAYRSAGVGRRILEQLVQDGRDLGYKTLRLETLTYMTAAHVLYRSMGFVDAESFEAEGADNDLARFELFMELSL